MNIGGQRNMTFEGVMVSYNFSKDGERSDILTVSASGIRFSDRWVLTHGSMLYPLKEAQIIQNLKGKAILNEEFYSKLPEVHVTCEKKSNRSNIYDNIEKISRERNEDSDMDLEHSSYLITVLTGRICHVWQCPFLERCVDEILYSWSIGYIEGNVEKQTQASHTLISAFVLIDLDSDVADKKILRPLSSLLDMVQPPPDRGSMIEIHSTPFGCEAFLNTTTRGVVCGVLGRRPTLLLTDAATALGCEGGPVFTEGPTKELIGIVICSVSWCRGEWVGLNIVAPLISVLSAKLRVALPKIPRPLAGYPQNEILDSIDSCTMLVRCGAAWGSGLYLGAGFVLTCSHVVKNYNMYKISVYCQKVKETAIVRYKTRDDKAYDLALLYTNPDNWKHLKSAVFANEPVKKGETILAAGYPYFNENNLPDLKPTVTSGHVNNVSPSLIQASCCVQSGFSGGPIFRITKKYSVEVIAVIVSNAKTQTGAYYPYVNMSIPVQVFKHVIRQFMIDKDITKLRVIENDKDIIQAQWNLLPYKSKI